MDAHAINKRLAALGVDEEALRVDPDGAPPSGIVVLDGRLLNRLKDAERRPGMLLGSIAMGEAEALRILDELAPGWRTDTDD